MMAAAQPNKTLGPKSAAISRPDVTLTSQPCQAPDDDPPFINLHCSINARKPLFLTRFALEDGEWLSLYAIPNGMIQWESGDILEFFRHRRELYHMLDYYLLSTF